MSPVQCAQCGLFFINNTGSKQCYAFGRNIGENELKQQWLCTYFLPEISENGQPLTPFQHFLLKQNEINRKK